MKWRVGDKSRIFGDWSVSILWIGDSSSELVFLGALGVRFGSIWRGRIVGEEWFVCVGVDSVKEEKNSLAL